MKLILEEAEQIAFADKQVSRKLLYIPYGTKIFVDVGQCFGYDGRQRGALLGWLSREEVQIEKQLGKKVGGQSGKGLLVADPMVKFAFAKDLHGNGILLQMNDLLLRRDPIYTLYPMVDSIEQNVVALVSGYRVYLNKVILSGADQNEIPFF